MTAAGLRGGGREGDEGGGWAVGVKDGVVAHWDIGRRETCSFAETLHEMFTPQAAQSDRKREIEREREEVAACIWANEGG